MFSHHYYYFYYTIIKIILQNKEGRMNMYGHISVERLGMWMQAIMTTLLYTDRFY